VVSGKEANLEDISVVAPWHPMETETIAAPFVELPCRRWVNYFDMCKMPSFSMPRYADWDACDRTFRKGQQVQNVLVMSSLLLSGPLFVT
jgi:hypothetical protein